MYVVTKVSANGNSFNVTLIGVFESTDLVEEIKEVLERDEPGCQVVITETKPGRWMDKVIHEVEWEEA